MAITIVGKSNKYVHRTDCRNCSTTLEYTQVDLLRYDSKDYSGGSDGQEYFFCPNCAGRVVVNSW